MSHIYLSWLREGRTTVHLLIDEEASREEEMPRVCVCMCTSVCICVCMWVHVHTHVCKYVHACTRTNECASVHVCMCVLVNVYVYVCMCTRVCASICIYVYCVSAHEHTCVQVYVCVYTCRGILTGSDLTKWARQAGQWALGIHWPPLPQHWVYKYTPLYPVCNMCPMDQA